MGKASNMHVCISTFIARTWEQYYPIVLAFKKIEKRGGVFWFLLVSSLACEVVGF